MRLRRGGRAVDRAGLENRKAERSREFESHPLRALVERRRQSDCITVSHNKLADFNAVQPCAVKSFSCIASSVRFPNFQRRYMPWQKKKAFFLGAEGGCHYTPTGVAGTPRLPPRHPGRGLYLGNRAIDDVRFPIFALAVFYAGVFFILRPTAATRKLT